MNKKVKLFLLFIAIVLPLNLLISYISDGGKLSVKAFAGDFVVTLIIFVIIISMGKFGSQAKKL